MDKFKGEIKNASAQSTPTSPPCVQFLNGIMILHTGLKLVLLT